MTGAFRPSVRTEYRSVGDWTWVSLTCTPAFRLARLPTALAKETSESQGPGQADEVACVSPLRRSYWIVNLCGKCGRWANGCLVPPPVEATTSPVQGVSDDVASRSDPVVLETVVITTTADELRSYMYLEAGSMSASRPGNTWDSEGKHHFRPLLPAPAIRQNTRNVPVPSCLGAPPALRRGTTGTN